MTDITDNRRGELRDAAHYILDNPFYNGHPARELAEFILATVDAPVPALAEELRKLAHEAIGEDGYPLFGGDRELLALAARAERMERELAEARAEVERLASGRPARIIDQAESLDRFKVGTVGRTARTLESWERDAYGWNSPNRTGGFASKDIIDRFGPMTILYDPKEEA